MDTKATCPLFNTSKRDRSELTHAVNMLYAHNRNAPNTASASRDQLIRWICKASRVPSRKPSPMPHPPNGTEPLFTQRRWISRQGVENNNCYSYAMDDYNASRPLKATPGARAKNDVNVNFSNCTRWANRVVRDNPDHVTLLKDPYASPPKGSFKVMLFTTGEGPGDEDFHFYRQHRSGVWSHKRGHATPPLIRDASARVIWDPLKANRTYGNLNYRKHCGTFAVRSGALTV